MSLQPVVSIPEFIKANFRRSLLMGLFGGVIGLVALTLTGHPEMGLFGGLGVALGMLNLRLVARSVVAYGANGLDGKKKLLTTSIAGRLGLTTVLAVVIAFVFAPAGVAVFGGLALFQFIVLANTALPAMKGLRQS